MPDLDKLDRTWLCSVLFMDIVNYSSQAVDLQMTWKKRFNGYLASSIGDVPENERVILDTGDGAAVCFLGAPEAAMFAALQLSGFFAADEREQKPGLRVRLGINLGPVKLVRDINGALNAIGDGINAGQRIMSFAAENQILVSQSFYEVVSRLSDDYRLLFHLKGVETDKHVREHTVYHLTPPGAERPEPVVAESAGRIISAKTAKPNETPPVHKTPWVAWLIAGAAVLALGAVAITHFRGASPPEVAGAAAKNTSPDAQSVTQASVAPQPAAKTPASSQLASETKTTAPPAAPAKAETLAPASSSEAASGDALAAYMAGAKLIEEDRPAEATRRFDEAIHDKPDYIDAYLGQAEARRKLTDYQQSLEDCDKAVQLRADDSRGYLCRGFGHQMLKQFDVAVADFTQALRISPKLVIAYEHRGAVYEQLEQFDHAVDDYAHAIAIAPHNPVFYVRRGTAYNNLRQYDNAIRDFTEAIRLQPNTPNAYRLRAIAEQATGNTAAAQADRAHLGDAPRDATRRKKNQ